MKIKKRCPKCNEKIEIAYSTQMFTSKIKCPGCDSILTVFPLSDFFSISKNWYLLLILLSSFVFLSRKILPDSVTAPGLLGLFVGMVLFLNIIRKAYVYNENERFKYLKNISGGIIAYLFFYLTLYLIKMIFPEL